MRPEHRPVIDLAAHDGGLGLSGHVRRLRLESGLSQAGLARALGTTQSAVARLESGRQAPTVETLRRLADCLGCEFVVHVAPSQPQPGVAA